MSVFKARAFDLNRLNCTKNKYMRVRAGEAKEIEMEEAAALGDGDAVLDESESIETVLGPPLATKISPLAGS